MKNSNRSRTFPTAKDQRQIAERKKEVKNQSGEGREVFIERWESDDKVQGHREYYRILDVDIYICINYCLRI